MTDSDWEEIADLYAFEGELPQGGGVSSHRGGIIGTGALGNMVRHVMDQPAGERWCYSINTDSRSFIRLDQIEALWSDPSLAEWLSVQ